MLKKVDDGIVEFADYYEQATAAGSNQQRERLGEELKKSINKLQRLRAQIREWIAQSGVQSSSKDKLEDARRRIENDMQRFKEFERELKTKAFSTCALSRADELELEEAEKITYQEWLQSSIQSLQDQLDQFEADLELLGNKKSLSNDEKSKLTNLKSSQERHRWHIKKLELILRGLDNDALDMSDLALVRESVDRYVDGQADPDEGLYDCFDLAEFEDKAVKAVSPPEDLKECTPTSSKEEPQRKAKDKDKRKKEEKKDKKKEDREKKAVTTLGGTSTAKATGTPQNGAASGGSSNKASGSKPGDSKIALQLLCDEPGNLSETRERIDPDEVKVQEDQLLSEAEEFVCKICQIHVVGCGPKLTCCSHLFCGDCIAQWFAQHPQSQTWAQRARAAGPERVVPCPVCKQPLNEKRDLYPVCGVTSRSENLLLWRMLSSLKIMCVNHPKVRPDGKCDWIGEYGSYQKHMRGCRNLPVAETPANPEVATAVDQSRRSTPGMATSSPAMSPAVSPMPSPVHVPEASPGLVSCTSAPALSEGVTEATTPGTSAPNAVGSAAAPSRAAAPAAPPGWDASQRAFLRGLDGRDQQTISLPPASTSTVQPAPARSAAAAPASSRTVTADTPTTEEAAPKANSTAHSVVPPAATETKVSPSAAQSAAPARTTTGAAAVNSAAQPAAAPAPTRTASTNEVVASEAEASKSHRAAATGLATAEEKAPASTVQRSGTEAQKKPATPEPEGPFIVPATCSFEPTGSNMVQVRPNDMIQVLERHASGWAYCKNLSSSSASNAGWAPCWIVQPAQPAVAPAPVVEAKPKVSEVAQPIQVAQPTKEKVRTPQPATGSVVIAPTPTPVSSAAAPATATVAQAAQQAKLAAPQVETRSFLRATSSFNATSPSQLTIVLSDLVEIIERHPTGWTYGRRVCEAPQAEVTAVEGWFPDWVVCAQK